MPGLRQLWLIEARHLLGLTDPRTLPTDLTGWTLPENGLQLSEDAQVINLRFLRDRSGYSQKATNSVHGIAYAQALVLEIPRDHAQTTLFVARMTGRKWVAVYQDGNGLYKLVGTPSQPLRFSAEFKAAPNGYMCSWTTDTRWPAYHLAEQPGRWLLDAEFSYGFSYDFYS